MKKSLGAVLQYGWAWGHPRSISKEDWQTIREAYKVVDLPLPVGPEIIIIPYG